MKAFKAYDIRGEWGTDLNEEIAYRIGFYLNTVLKAPKILVGRDIRLSSNAMHDALIKGITDSGCDVDDIGLATTPMTYWATAKYDYQGSVMITASHNPKNHNGLKVSCSGAMPVGYDAGLEQVEALVESGETPNVSPNKGKVKELDIRDEYLAFQKGFVHDMTGLNIAIDCSNGMSSLFVHELFGEAHYINDNADGNFPAHEPNPLEPVNQGQIKEFVKKTGSDIGLLFDGDADRVVFIDENGEFVSPDLIIALLGDYFMGEHHREGIVLQDIRSSKAVQEYLSKYGSKVVTWRVGRAFAAPRLREMKGCYGGELAGHYYFSDFYYSDSALLAASLVLHLVKQYKDKGVTMSQIIRNITPYYNSGEINFKLNRKTEAMNAVRDHFVGKEKPLEYMDFDGYRLDYPDFWLNIRPSNTEPYLRFIAEAKSESKLQEIISTATQIINSFKE